MSHQPTEPGADAADDNEAEVWGQDAEGSEPEPPPSAPRNAHDPKASVRPAEILLESILDDDTFRIKDAQEHALLATDLARLGQLYPLDVRPVGDGQYQVVSGFRRFEALKFLQREHVWVRVHATLSDEDAWLLALGSGIHERMLTKDDLESVYQRLDQHGQLSPSLKDMLEKAFQGEDEVSPGPAEEEIDADELATEVTLQLGQLNQDLSLLGDVFQDIDPERQQALIEQLGYARDLLGYLERAAESKE